MATQHQVNRQRFLADLAALASIDRDASPASGASRPTSAAVATRTWLTRRLDAAGITYTIDTQGNLITTPPDNELAAAVLIGRFNEGPAAGPLDSALGVVAGLECLRRAGELPREAALQPLAFLAISHRGVVAPGDIATVLKNHAGSPRTISSMYSMAVGPLAYDPDVALNLGLNICGYASTPVARLFASAGELDVDLLPLEDEGVEFEPGSGAAALYELRIPYEVDSWPIDEVVTNYATTCTNVILNAITAQV